jgi:translation initiation factor 1
MTKNSRSSTSGLVYSTDAGGRMWPGCRQPHQACLCRTSHQPPAGDGTVRVSLETKGRAGKGVTVVKGWQLDAAALAQAAKQLKTACGCGGTVKAGVIEIQGDHRDLVVEHLKRQGCTVKRVGG